PPHHPHTHTHTLSHTRSVSLSLSLSIPLCFSLFHTYIHTHTHKRGQVVRGRTRTLSRSLFLPSVTQSHVLSSPPFFFCLSFSASHSCLHFLSVSLSLHLQS